VFADYGLENGIDVLARTIRQEREAVGTNSELIPWFTPVKQQAIKRIYDRSFFSEMDRL